MAYIKRRLEESVRRALKRNPVAAVIGPRQCGKSTLVKHLREDTVPSVYLDLERPSDLAKLSDPELFFTGWLIDGHNHDSGTRCCGFSGFR